VGLVYIGLARRGGVRARRFLFRGDRLQIRDRAANAALLMVLETLRSRV
jgi:nicotinamide mononucleotide (NMN) deamidase PncC